MNDPGADPRPGTRDLRDTALDAFSIELVATDPDRVVARMPAPDPNSLANLHVLTETVASVAAGLSAGAGRRAFGAELDAATLFHTPSGPHVEAVATPLTRGSDRHVWQIDVHDAAGNHVSRGRCTLAVVDVRED